MNRTYMQRLIMQFSKKILCIIMVMGISFGFVGCTPEHPITLHEVLMDTVISITVYSKNHEETALQAMELCREYEQQFSNNIEQSDISRINNNPGKFVEVSEETIELLMIANEYYELSNGLFDISIGTISGLWEFHGDGRLPENHEIASHLPHIGMDQVEINQQAVRLLTADVKLDVGGIAKGYIADKIKLFMTESGVEHAVINLGGNVLTIGSKPDGSAYRIGIQRPFGETNDTVTSVELQDESVVTAGVYQRYFEINGKQYHHILHPDTGYPVESDLLSASIVTRSSVDADALSTICILLGKKEAAAFIASLEDVKAIFVDTQNNVSIIEGTGYGKN